MSQTDWKELLDDEEVRRIVTKVVNGPGRRMYNPYGRAALLFDDLESYLWDRSVDIAMSFEWDQTSQGQARDDDERDPDLWYRVLYSSLVTACTFLIGQTGMRGSAKREAWNRGVASVEGVAEAAARGESVNLESRLDLSDPFWWHHVSRSDPLGILLRRERLLAMIRAAEHRARQGAYVTETSPDVLCREPLCRNLAHSAGYCRGHYRHHFVRWGRLDGTSPACDIDNCDLVATSRGMCHVHYIQEAKRRRAEDDWWIDPEPGPCTVDGCQRIEKALGLCPMHYQQHREQTRPPCSEIDCDRNAFAKGLCRLHYRRRYERRAPDGTNLCQVPGCGRVIRSKGLCENHYRAQLRGHR